MLPASSFEAVSSVGGRSLDEHVVLLPCCFLPQASLRDSLRRLLRDQVWVQLVLRGVLKSLLPVAYLLVQERGEPI